MGAAGSGANLPWMDDVDIRARPIAQPSTACIRRASLLSRGSRHARQVTRTPRTQSRIRQRHFTGSGRSGRRRSSTECGAPFALLSPPAAYATLPQEPNRNDPPPLNKAGTHCPRAPQRRVSRQPEFLKSPAPPDHGTTRSCTSPVVAKHHLAKVVGEREERTGVGQGECHAPWAHQAVPTNRDGRGCLSEGHGHGPEAASIRTVANVLPCLWLQYAS